MFAFWISSAKLHQPAFALKSANFTLGITVSKTMVCCRQWYNRLRNESNFLEFLICMCVFDVRSFNPYFGCPGAFFWTPWPLPHRSWPIFIDVRRFSTRFVNFFIFLCKDHSSLCLSSIRKRYIYKLKDHMPDFPEIPHKHVFRHVDSMKAPWHLRCTSVILSMFIHSMT